MKEKTLRGNRKGKTRKVICRERVKVREKGYKRGKKRERGS